MSFLNSYEQISGMKSIPITEILSELYGYHFPFSSDIIKLDLLKKEEPVELNDILCLCGSGKQLSECHPDIHPASLVMAVWKKYTALDETIANEQKQRKCRPICEIGCNECCSDYFYVTPMEYYTLKLLLISQDKDTFYECCEKAQKLFLQLKRENPQEYLRLEQLRETDSDYDHEYLRKFARCPMLEDITGACVAYLGRPLLCRLHGTSMFAGICKKVSAKITPLLYKTHSERIAKKYLLPINPRDNELHEGITYHSVQNKKAVMQPLIVSERPYPLLYWLANDKQYSKGYALATFHPGSDYLKHLVKDFSNFE